MQGANQQCKSVKLTKEARAINQQQWDTNKVKYCAAVKSVEHELVEKAEALATTHLKSIRQVEKNLCSSCDLAQKHQKKMNTWNAFIWSQSQDKENISLLSSQTGAC